MEISDAVRGLFFNKEHETARVPLFEKYKGKLAELDKFVGEKTTVLGYLTIADYNVAEFSNFIQTVFPEQSKAFPFMKRIRDNFNSLPEIQAYYKSDGAFKGPFYPPSSLIKVETE